MRSGIEVGWGGGWKGWTYGEERRRLVLGAEIEVGVECYFEAADAVVAGVAVEISAGAATASAAPAARHY